MQPSYGIDFSGDPDPPDDVDGWLKFHCNFLTHNRCRTVHCYKRAGWVPGQKTEDFQPMCPAREIWLKLKEKE